MMYIIKVARDISFDYPEVFTCALNSGMITAMASIVQRPLRNP